MRRPVSVALSLAFPLAALLLIAVPTQAQERSAELQQLDYFVGTWSFTYQGSEGTWVCGWFGETFVQCDAEVTDASGNRVATVDMFAYDAMRGVYSWHRFLTNGSPQASSGWLHGDVWTYVFDEPVGAKVRALLIADTPGVLTLRWEDAVEGGDWESRSEFRMTKVQ